METIATEDEALMELYLGGEDVSDDMIKKAIRQGTLANDFVPILCGSAFKNKGVQPMLDAVIDYLPSPLDIEPAHGTNMRGDEDLYRGPNDEPFAALAFKIVADPFGKLTYFRVYSGEINKGDEVYNSTKEKRERLGRILLMHANQREDLDVAMAGDIVAGLGFKDVTTGDTLCDRDAPVILERMEFPEPVIHVAIEPKTKSDQDKLGKALKSLSDEDPTFRIRTDDETGQTVISGMGELHLEVLVDRMLREFSVEATVGKPQVAYRETITKNVDTYEYRHIKQSGGSGQFAVVKIKIEPNPGKGYEFEDKITGGKMPREYIQPDQPGHPGRPRVRRARRLRDGRRQGQPRRRPVPRRRLLGDGVQDRRSDGLQGGRREGQARAARADHGRRGRHPRGVHGRRHRRPEQPSRPRRGHGGQRQHPAGQGAGAAVGDVRVQYRPSLAHPGPRDLHDAVRPVPAGARGDRLRHREASPRRVIAAVTGIPSSLTTHQIHTRRQS